MKTFVGHVRTLLPTRKALLVAAALLVALFPQRALANSTADLSVSISGSPDPVARGGLVTWTVTVTNLGPDTATAVRLQAIYGSDAEPISATTTQGTCAPTGEAVEFSLGTIPNGAAVTITAVMKNWGGDGRYLFVRVSSASTDPVSRNNEVDGEVDTIPGPVSRESPTGLFCPPTGGVSTGGGGTAPGSAVWVAILGTLAIVVLFTGAITVAWRWSGWRTRGPVAD